MQRDAFCTIDKENLCEPRTLLTTIIQERFYLNGGVETEKLKLVRMVIFSHGILIKVKDKHERLIRSILNTQILNILGFVSYFNILL